MTKAALLALADKLEKANGPSRELDALIHAAVTGKDVIYDGGERPHSAVIVGSETWANRDGSENATVEGYAPAYTASIDAALTLVPEGFSGSVYFGAGPLQVANVNCHICGPDVNVSEDHTGIAPTSPLALCAAALRARAA